MTITEQPTLFDAGLPVADVPGVVVRRDAPLTSVMAAALALPRSGTQRFAILRVIADAGAGGLTDHEIVDRLRLQLCSVNPRRFELVGMGWVVDSGQRRRYRGHSDAIVWRPSLRGQREFADPRKAEAA